MKRLGKQFLMLAMVMALLVSQVNYMSMTVQAEETDVTLTGTVVEVQKYGNLTMDIMPSALYEAGFELGDMMLVTLGEQTFEIPFVTSYSDVDTGSLLVRDDQKNDIVVVAINMGNFSTTYEVEAGDILTFELLEKGTYLAEYLLRQLERTNVRSDYALDSVYANFRSITTTGINPGVLYRSSSPINNELNRSAYADILAEAVGIATVINLADSTEEIVEYRAGEEFRSDYYMSLYDNGQVVNLDMDVDIAGADFSEKLVTGLRYLNEHEGPYLVHCTEGKDRAGFVAAVLEALMGASMDEVVADYMTTYENYYGVEAGSEQYNAIAESNIITSMTVTVCGLEKGSDLSEVDLQAATESYLMGIGLTADEIATLKTQLSAESMYKEPYVMGTVQEIEKYGHTSTDILIEDFYAMGYEAGDMMTVIYDNGFVVEAPFLDGYYVDNGNPLVRAYPGHETVAVCINYGKIYDVADVEVGDELVIMLSEADAYLSQYEIRKLERTNERADYASDEIFANFRSIELGTIGEGVLFRSSSPINPELGRAMYADQLIEAAGVMTVVNLADSAENIAEYTAAEDFASPYYKSLYDAGKVVTLNMGLAYASDEFRASVVEGMIFISENEAPYHFHCTEGKDRAGFFAALTEALMGASLEEIVDDYMTSYINYYNVEPGTEKYDLITEDVKGMLKYIANSDDLIAVDLQAAAEAYLMNGGMTAEQIEAVQANLAGSVAEEPVIEEPVVEEPAVEEPTAEEPTASSETYTVVAGDTLYKIAVKTLGDGDRYMEIFELNKETIKNVNLIYVDQVIMIP